MCRLILVFFVFVGIHEANACEGEKIGYNDKGKSKKVDKDLTGFGMIATDKKYKFNCCGTINKWRARAGAPGDVAFQVWRPTGKKGEYKLMGQNVVKFDKAESKAINIPANQRISVSPGDIIGWYTKTSGVIIYDDGGSNNNFVLKTMPDASFGDQVDWSSAKRVNKRSYSIEASGAKNFPPTVRNLPEKLVIKKDHPLGDLFNVEVSDNDKLDINEMKVELKDPSEYFGVKPGTTMIILKKEPKVWKHVLRVIVSDHCDKTAPLELTVTVTDTGDTSSTAVTSAPVAQATDSEEDFIWDWLVYALVAITIVLVAVALLIFFHKKGWLHKAHRTHPPKKDMKDAEKANGNKIDDISKTEPKKDDISKGESKQDGVANQDAKQNDVKPNETPKDVKKEGSDVKDVTKTKYVKPI